ncbi:MAG: bifunctional diguanylate cyclase/phosphodiesterase [Persephonella sp.]|nr:bifunctional diguanylate cyclase/phosphodiesterase [Persephonella sp.]
MKRADFENLRQNIALKSGSVIENLLKDFSLIKGMRISIERNFSSNYHEKSSFLIFLSRIEKLLEQNIQLVKEESIDALNLISILEKEVVDKKLLEKETKILRKIVLSRENILNWKVYATEILKDLKSVYNFDAFFFFFDEEKKKKIYIFYSNKFRDEDRQFIKKSIKQELKEKLKNYFTEIEEIYISKTGLKKDYKQSIVEYYQFLPESPEIGGIIGVVVLSERKITRKELEILHSILSIMTLIVGSSKALSKAISELEYYAGHDPLTDLYNRRTFEDFLRYEISRVKRKNHRFSLIMIDLDNFKYINDTYGHQIGDIVLKSVADILEKSVREGDLVARIGGDEFVILLSETNLELAVKIAERLRENLEKNKICTLNRNIISVHASFGVVEYPTHGRDKEELMMIVDNALYRAKDLGKNIVYVPSPEEIEEIIYKQRKDFHILQKAIEEELFFPYFQPIFELSENRITAYECLARITDENGETVSAYSLISLAEKLGKAKDIDSIIINKSLKMKKERGIKEKLFINLSSKVISDNSFWSYVFSIINQYSINPEEIVFEITEREAVKGIAEVQQLIIVLKEKGFGFAIDDFGSGYSSFYYLKHFPIDFVKIDGEFIRELKPEDPKSTAFVESISLLCRKLGIKTVAEFVESRETVEILKSIGIHYGQGFYLGKPQPDFL